MSGEGREQFTSFIPAGDVARFASELPGKLATSFTDTMQLLRDIAFQDLLVNYPRPKRTFVVAYSTEDTVTSEWMVREGGKDYRPVDYLIAFAQFVKENADKIDAIKILLDRPQDWSTDTLVELKQKLTTAPERFTVEKLEKAHAVKYHKSLVDIISMVKHAVNEQEPLLTAQQRVDRALEAIGTAQTFDKEQVQWLERIRAHLVESLSIERDDFANVPVLLDAGGWARADRLFAGNLAGLIAKLNELIAA